jgi:hypothetical protein
MHRQNNAVAIVFAATSCVHFTNSMMEYREKKKKEKRKKKKEQKKTLLGRRVWHYGREEPVVSCR